MGLEDFEKELAASKAEDSTRKRHRSRSRSRDGHRSSRPHGHRSSRPHGQEDKDTRHRHHSHRSSDKTEISDRHRYSSDRTERSDRHRQSSDKTERSDRHRHSERDDHHRRHDRDRSPESKRIRSSSPDRKKVSVVPAEDDEWVEKEENDEWVEKEEKEEKVRKEETILDEQSSLPLPAHSTTLKRDSWMDAPDSISVDYVQRSRTRKSPPSQFVSAKQQQDAKVHRMEVDHLLKDLEEDDDAEGPDDTNKPPVVDEPAQHDVDYTFGDSGSAWRMTKLRGVYRKAKESDKTLEEAAINTYGDLRLFDDAREEERELERRAMYGKHFIGLDKPSGELFRERKLAAGLHRPPHHSPDPPSALPNAQIMQELPPSALALPLDQTALNKLKARMMKAKLRNAPDAADLEAEYEAAAAANRVQPGVVVLNAMENRMLTGGRDGEVNRIDNKRGRERGQVVENEDMSIEDMVRQEKRTKAQFGGEGRAFAERIAKDGKFDDNLDYMDENAAKLARNMAKSDINLRNTAIGDFHKMQKILDSCPLCHHEDTNTPPAAPIVSLATRVYMTMPTDPEITPGGAVIVPTQHHLSLLECDDDEWEEIRNFMKSLTRMYHQRDKGVIFYENAAFMHSRKGHAALFAVPLPFHLADNAPAYFKEAILSADEEWSQHKKLIDTLAKSRLPGFGKQAFRKSLVKEMPYFHVWFTMDGGLGHVIEDERRWPKGDLFAREVIGGMLGKGPDVIKKQGRWMRQDPRIEAFRKRWNAFDWTRVLHDAQ